MADRVRIAQACRPPMATAVVMDGQHRRLRVEPAMTDYGSRGGERGEGMIDRVWYATVFVTDFQRGLAFYRDTLGLPLLHADEKFGHAGFKTEGALFRMQKVSDEQTKSFSGRHTGIGFGVKDLDAEYERLKAKSVRFTMVPEKMAWGGYMALFADPDGNVFYLDQLRPE